MKKIIDLFFLTIPFVSSGQDKKLFDILPVTNGKVNYHDTIYLSKSRGDLENKIPFVILSLPPTESCAVLSL